MQKRIVELQKQIPKSQKYTDAYEYYEFIKKKKVCPTEKDLALASEPVLHEIIGVITSEKETEWDHQNKIPDNYLVWMYGLLCMIEKPLLPD